MVTAHGPLAPLAAGHSSGGEGPRAPLGFSTSTLRPLHGPRPLTLPIMIILSSIVHLAAAWGLLFTPAFRQQPRFQAPIMVRLVELPAGLGGLLSGNPGTPAEPPKISLPEHPQPAAPKTTLPGKVPPKNQPGAAPVQNAGRGVAAGMGKTGAAGLGGKGAGVLLDEPTFQYEWYKARLEDALKARWKRPVLNANLSASVHFVISAAGSAIEVQIVQSSGNVAFDQSVIRAVYDAAPYPKFPPGFSGEKLGVLYTFELRPDAGE